MPHTASRWLVAAALLAAPLAVACTSEPSGPCDDGFELDAGGRCVRWLGIRGLDDRSAPSGELLALADGRVLSWSLHDPIRVVDPDAEVRRWEPIQRPPFEFVSKMAQLADGSVVALGGRWEPLARFMARWDPSTDTWSDGTPAPLGDATSERMISLDDGTALVVGAGENGPRSWICDAATPELSPRAAPAGFATILASLGEGRAIRFDQSVVPHRTDLDAEVFDAEREGWRSATMPAIGYYVGAVARLPNGDLLATGWNDRDGREAWIYTPLIDVWRPASPPLLPGRSMAVLGDGAVLSIGGDPASDVEIYDPERDTWTSTASPWPHGDDWAVASLPDGRVIAKSGSESAIFEQR